ncbi:hypothetical protein A9R01_07445 ['Osedax' symbiont bacterium Rs2_46_30_T18]|nr:hypothetical protein A9R01_07445 ['Osedax' symbiont bacterium Rs2_46_30_T18]
MKSYQKIGLVFLIVLLPLKSYAVSISDVYHKVAIVIAELDALKMHYAPDTKTRVPGIQVGKTPVHAYTKGLELLEKIQRFQQQNKLPTLEIPKLPSKRVKSKNVLVIVDLAEQEIAKIVQSLNLTVAQVTAAKSSKTASDVYQKIWRASYLMDAMVEPVKASAVLRNALMIEQGLIVIAERMNKPMQLPAVQSFIDKTPQDVTIQLFKLLYKLALIERKLKLKPLVIPAFPVGEIKSEDAYDASGNVIADITRITLKLKIAPMSRQEIPQGQVSPSDVYAQIVRLNSGAQILLEKRSN